MCIEIFWMKFGRRNVLVIDGVCGFGTVTRQLGNLFSLMGKHWGNICATKDFRQDDSFSPFHLF